MYECLCFSGGGIKGIMELGVLHTLTENNLLDLKEVSGNSVGALVATVAALKLNINQVIDTILTTDFVKLTDLNLINFLSSKGLCNNKYLRKFIENITVRADITFSEAFNLTKIKLNIVCSDIQTKSLKCFNYINTPNVKISDAILASTAIPLIYPPVVIEGRRYVDGLLINNTPYNVIEHQGKTLVIYFGSNKHDEESKCKDGSENIFSFIKQIFFCMTEETNNRILQNIKDKDVLVLNYKIIRDSSKISEFFNLGIDEKITLFYHGKEQSAVFMRLDA